jgi:hypothetical protein
VGSITRYLVPRKINNNLQYDSQPLGSRPGPMFSPKQKQGSWRLPTSLSYQCLILASPRGFEPCRRRDRPTSAIVIFNGLPQNSNIVSPFMSLTARKNVGTKPLAEWFAIPDCPLTLRSFHALHSPRTALFGSLFMTTDLRVGSSTAFTPHRELYRKESTLIWINP